jgi:dipeptide/tripeptide permease
MFYMSINIGATISMLSMVPIKDTYGYAVAFLFPAGLMALAFVLFAAGKQHYAVEVIEIKKKTKEDYLEMLRVVRKVGLVFLMVVVFWALFDQASSTWIFFGSLFQENFSVPLLGRMTAERVQGFNPLFIVIFLPFVTYLWTALANRGVHVKATSKLMIGFLLTVGCMASMAIPGFLAGPPETVFMPRSQLSEKATYRLAVEKEAREAWPPALDATWIVGSMNGPGSLPSLATSANMPVVGKIVYVRPENKVTLWWQVLAYLVLTIAEIFISVTGLEMAFVVASNNMKGFVTSLWLLTVFLAALLNTLMAQIYPNMHPGHYFVLLTGMMVAVMIIFVFVARDFNRIVAAESAAATEGAATTS